MLGKTSITCKAWLLWLDFSPCLAQCIVQCKGSIVLIPDPCEPLNLSHGGIYSHEPAADECSEGIVAMTQCELAHIFVHMKLLMISNRSALAVIPLPDPDWNHLAIDVVRQRAVHSNQFQFLDLFAGQANASKMWCFGFNSS